RELTDGIGVDRVIDAVGVDATRPSQGPAAEQADELAERFERERATVAPDAAPDEDTWVPGDAPSLALRWAVDAVAKAGTLGVIGVYPPTFEALPFGVAMNKNLTINAGNCNHRKYIPGLLDLVSTGVVDPTTFITKQEEPVSAVAAYRRFDRREDGWLKTVLEVA
ncbi:MAG TPA: glutathione-dependent formaldehyde dehydrogenase, partial [Pseudonocardiaceae bacterium]|nr:glutathione-dependent formaldehyde dehydrogenase [Pseudonocardiaceae bacterium]